MIPKGLGLDSKTQKLLNMPRSIHPPLNMHFIVEFNNKELITDKNFQSVSGLKARIHENEDKKGTHIQFENIILKRAYQPDSGLVKWCMDAINNNKKEPTNLIVRLLNADHDMLSGWQIEKAIPIAWGVEELHAQETKILIETIELSYQCFHVLNSKGKVIAPPTKPIKKK